MKEEKLRYLLALLRVEGIGAVLAKNLIAYCGSPQNVFTASKSALKKVPGIGPATVESVINFKDFGRVEQELDFIKRKNLHCTSFYCEDYPYRLKPIYDAPLLLFKNGKSSYNAKRTVAVIGTRKPSVYGSHLCKKLIADLKLYDCQILSGLAYGIDATAHIEAINQEMDTLAIMAHGMDRIYPPAHRKLAQKIAGGNGALLSELMSKTKPDRENFPRRNRIVAGMADAVVVVESPSRGGSMITAEYAWEFDRPIFVFPGRVSDSNSLGCLKLIKEHKATLIESANDLVENMNWSLKKEARQVPLFELSSEEQMILRVLQHEKTLHIEKLVEKSGLNAGKLAYLLLELEFKKVVLCKPGKLYELA